MKSNKTEVREIITYYDCQSTMNRQIFDQFYPNTTIISGTNTRYLKYHIICSNPYVLVVKRSISGSLHGGHPEKMNCFSMNVNCRCDMNEWYLRYWAIFLR